MKTKIIALAICLLFITGCGDKKLICTNSETFAGDEYLEQITFIYDRKGKEVKSYIIYEEQTYKDTSDMDEDYENLLAYCEDFNTSNGASCKVTRKARTLSITIEVDIKAIGHELSGALAEVVKMSYDEMRKQLEADHFTCK